MASLAPPPLPPRVALADDWHLYRMHFRLWQIFISFFTVLVTAWLCNFGAVSADTKLPPQTVKEELIIAAKNSFDYSSFIIAAIQSGINMSSNSCGAPQSGSKRMPPSSGVRVRWSTSAFR